MKKAALIAFIAISLAGLVVLWFRNPEAVDTAVARPWPGGMARLEVVTGRYLPLKANGASAELMALAEALPQNEVVDDFVEREIARGELTIGDPPVLADVSAIRELLLREEVGWEHEVGIGGGNEANARRTIQMRVARALVASALAKARANDPAAWDDLHAVWKLAGSVGGHPQMMAQTAALSMVRMINAVAWKMPLPTPAWLDELQARHDVRRLLESFQFQTAWYWENAWISTKWLANSIDHDRAIAEELFSLSRCDVNTPVNELGTDLTSVWRRAFRYRAELEATANALRVREGKPIETASRCTDGAWTFDGTTLRFTREIATAPPDNPMPLVLRLKP